MAGMKDTHRMFLQAFMSRNILDAKEVKLLYKNCCERFDDEYSTEDDERRQNLADLVIKINTNIKQFHMEIRKGISEDNGSNYYGLVNISESPITRLASDYTQNELELFKKIIEKIVESETGLVGTNETLNLTEKLDKKISKKDAEDFLARLQGHKWIQIEGGMVSLDTRAILELDQYIKEVFPNLAILCNLCKRLCLKGQSCDNCDTKLHHHCAKKYLSMKDASVCPRAGCNAPWPFTFTELGTIICKKEATDEDDEAQEQTRSSRSSRQK